MFQTFLQLVFIRTLKSMGTIGPILQIRKLNLRELQILLSK